MDYPSKSYLVESLRGLSIRMAEVAEMMRAVGGFNETYQHHAGELDGAASIASQWAKEIEKVKAE